MGTDKAQLKEDTTLAPFLKMSLELMLMMAERLGLHSKIAAFLLLKIKTEKNYLIKSNKHAGGQTRHKGTTLTQTNSPDEIKTLVVERDTLPKGQYHEVGFIKR